MILTWWGHATVLVEVGATTLLTDPVLRPRMGLLRHVAPPGAHAWVQPDVVLLSHLHHDHCDLPSLRGLDAPVVLVPAGAAGWLTRRGVRGGRDLAIGDRVDLPGGIQVRGVPAAHHGRREPFGPEAPAMGHLVSDGRLTAWFAGDTGLHDAMADLPGAAPRGVIDLAVVPIWGWGPNLGPGHLDPEQAAEAVARVGARDALAVHWGSLHPAGMRTAMRHHLRTPGDRFAAAVARHSPGTRVHRLAPGDTLEL